MSPTHEHTTHEHTTHELLEWSAGSLANVLQKAKRQGVVYVLEGIGNAQVLVIEPDLRSALQEHGMLLLTMDPTGARSPSRTLANVIDEYMYEVGRGSTLPAVVEELVEWLHTMRAQITPSNARNYSIITDTLCRLWMALAESAPAVLVLYNSECCGVQVQEQLHYLARYYFNDPIEALGPEFGALECAQGALVAVCPEPGVRPDFLSEALSVELLDATVHLERHVRAYLEREDVIRRLTKTTRGDIQKLDEFVAQIEDNVTHMLLRRFEGLAFQERMCVALLSTLVAPIEMSLLHAAMSLQGGREHFSRVVKALIASRMVSRVIQSGEVLLGLTDISFRDAVYQSLEEETRFACHHAWCDVMQASSSQGKCVSIFIAHHALRCDRFDVAVEYGVCAARELFRMGALEEASTLLDELIPHTTCDVLRAETIAMQVDINARMGLWLRAFMSCEHLEELVSGARGRAELACRKASILMKLNRFEEAIATLDVVSTLFASDPSLCVLHAQALTEQGDAHYKLGRQNKGHQLSVLALKVLDEGSALGHVPTSDGVRTRIKARNLQGAVAIFRAQYEEACVLFEKNLEDAELWGWDDDAAFAVLNLGVVAMQRRQDDEASLLLRRALKMSRGIDHASRTHSYFNLAVFHQYRQEYEESLRCYLETLRAARQSKNDTAYASAAFNLCTLYLALGAFDRAEHLIAHLGVCDGPRRHVFVARWTGLVQVKLMLETGRAQCALELIESTVEDESSGFDILQGSRTRHLLHVQCLMALERVASAKLLMSKLDVSLAHDDAQVEALECMVRAQLDFAQDSWSTAHALASQASKLFDHLGDFREFTRARLLMVQAQIKMGELSSARLQLTELLVDMDRHAQRVPQALLRDYWATPLYMQIVVCAMGLGVVVHNIRLLGAYQDHLGFGVVERESESSKEARSEQWSRWRARYGAVIGESPRLHQIFKVIDRIAPSDTSVLILGESGTGKELIATAIHEHSDRASKPFIKVNCASFVETLLMSELFGHEKGSFTGALQQKIGRFELADGGTLFLDEIADISPQTQVALLRALQERQFERVGGTQTQHVDVRLVCATNKNLEVMVKEGTFRLDLYYRLKGMVLELPALCERREDIPRLIDAFCTQCAQDHKTVRFDHDVLRFLVSYSWPGNVREVQNFVRSVLLFVEGDTVTMAHVHEFEDFFAGGEFDDAAARDLAIWHAPETQPETHLTQIVSVDDVVVGQECREVQSGTGPVLGVGVSPEEAIVDQIMNQDFSLNELKSRLELECIKRALLTSAGNVTQAARLLQMKRPRLSQIINSNPELSALKAKIVG